MFWIILIILILISIFSSVMSFVRMQKKTAIEKNVEEELAKGKVVFHKEAYSSSSGSDSSSSDL